MPTYVHIIYYFFHKLQRHEERVIIISSKDNEDAFTDAENALHKIGSLVLMVM